jgi:protein Tex
MRHALDVYAQTFINEERAVTSSAEALEGARHIIAEQISETPSFANTCAR